jgi:hypothetical protein
VIVSGDICISDNLKHILFLKVGLFLNFIFMFLIFVSTI